MKKSYTDSFAEAFGKTERLFVYEQADSTNAIAKLFAASDKSRESAVFVAKRQSAGRGRLGRSFSSEEGGLYLSYLSYPTLAPREAIRLTVYAAVCVCETVEELTGAKPAIKWVNDVYLGGKKLAGILTEGAFSEDGSRFLYSVTGIGVNLLKTEFPPELLGIATDLETECGIAADVGLFAKTLTDKLSRFTPGEKSYMDEYRKRCFHLGEEVTVITPSKSFDAVAKEILDDGSLTVVDRYGEKHVLFTGEVSLKVKKHHI